jgi:hypothetical protein
MRFFLSVEFVESVTDPLYLTSLGVISERGTELYVVNPDHCDMVALSMDRDHMPLIASSAEIGPMLRQFVLRDGAGSRPHFYGYCCAYDWVAVCNIYGGSTHVPKEFPLYCSDVRQMYEMLDKPALPPKPGHCDAIGGARWVKDAWLCMVKAAASDGRPEGEMAGFQRR